MADARVEQILAELAGKANAAKVSQQAAAEAARAKIAAMGGRAAMARDLDTGVELDVPAPESGTNYDFESQVKPDIEPEFTENGTRILKEATPSERLAAARADASRVLGEGTARTEPTLKMKVESRAHPMPEAPNVSHLPGPPETPMAIRTEQLREDMKYEAERHRARVAGDPAPQAPVHEAVRSNVKSIEQLALEDAERQLGRKPLLPPETGAMEGQPVQEMIDRRGSNLGRAAGERRGAAEGKILTTAEDAAQINAPKAADVIPDISDTELKSLIGEIQEDSTQGTIKRSVPNASRRFAGRLAARAAREGGEVAKAAKWYSEAAEPVVNASLKARAGRMLGTAAGKGIEFAETHPKLAKAGAWLAEGVTNQAKALKGEYWSKPLEGFGKAGKLGKAWRVGKVAVGSPAKFAAKEAVLPWLLEKIGEGGVENMYENLGATGRPPEMPGRGTSLGTQASGFSSAMDAQTEQINNLLRYNKSANKYGLKVSGRTGLGEIVGVPFLNRLIPRDPKIEVTEDPDLKAAYLAQNKIRIREMQEQWAVNQAKGHSE